MVSWQHHINEDAYDQMGSYVQFSSFEKGERSKQGIE